MSADVTNADHGRCALGEAEQSAFGGTELETEVAVAELTALATIVTAGEWWGAAGGPAVSVATARTSARSSRARRRGLGPVVITLAAGQHDVGTLAHELGHALAGVGHGHDPWFRAAEIDLVAFLAGPATADRLATACAAFELAVAVRPWPPPWRLTGPDFLLR